MTAVQQFRPGTLSIRKLDFGGDESGAITDESFRADLLAGVTEDGVVVVRDFPCDGGALVRFGREFGELEPADPFSPNISPDDPMDWLGHTKAQIFEALRVRTGNDTSHEIEAALQQIAAITRRRLNTLFGTA